MPEEKETWEDPDEYPEDDWPFSEDWDEIELLEDWDNIDDIDDYKYLEGE